MASVTVLIYLKCVSYSMELKVNLTSRLKAMFFLFFNWWVTHVLLVIWNDLALSCSSKKPQVLAKAVVFSSSISIT